MSRKKKKPSAKGRRNDRRKARKRAVAIVKWALETTAAIVLAHYVSVLMGW